MEILFKLCPLQRIDDNNSALEDYDNEYIPLRYSDIAPYPWGPDFHLEPLTSWLDGFTLKEQYRLESNLGGNGANIGKGLHKLQGNIFSLTLPS